MPEDPHIVDDLDAKLAAKVEQRVIAGANASPTAPLDAARERHRAQHGNLTGAPAIGGAVRAVVAASKESEQQGEKRQRLTMDDAEWEAWKAKEAAAAKARAEQERQNMARATWAKCRATLPARAVLTIEAPGFDALSAFEPGIFVRTAKALASTAAPIVAWIGPYGPGKTTAAAALAYRWCTNAVKSCRYTVANRLAADFEHSVHQRYTPFAAWEADWTKPDLLIIDELDAFAPEAYSDGGRQQRERAAHAITSMLVRRDGEAKPTLLIGNMTPEDITGPTAMLGPKVASRCTHVIPWTGADRRAANNGGSK
jgi:DNA replication protein DnaC